jgi:hypothetical protein
MVGGMELVPLHCPVCGSAIPGENVHLELAIARCPACKAVYDLAGRKAPPRAPSAPVPAPRAKVPLPAKFQVDDRGHDGMSVSWRWYSPVLFGLLFFCVAWDSFLLFWYGAALAGDAPWIMIVFPLAHVAVGVGLTYYLIAGFLNRTYVEVSRAQLSIRHAPMPWPGNLDVPGRALTQLYSTEEIRRGKNGTTTTYALNAIDRSGVKRKLLKGLTEIEQVLWLEQALERQLGIEDRPVEGELARRSA